MRRPPASRSHHRGACTRSIVILLVLIRQGLWRTLDGEKVRFFLGWTPNPLYLSRRFPLIRRLPFLRLLCSPRYARGVGEWLRYRADLYDGRQG